ncbi:MAG: Putative nucleoside transporter YegT [Opitutia bacterium UBA7350]|nr:MAG: Putative nucleoside transporter YegT [Opitutae bacterium UBA7350]
MMAVVMFLMFLPPGMWLPSLPNVLEAHGARWALPYFMTLTPFMSIFSALIFGSLSDRRMDARYLLGILGLSGAGFLWLAFASLEWGWHAGWFLFFQSCNALISAPMIALITKVKLANLLNPAKHFPLYSIGGTLGWLVGSIWVSMLALDHSAQVGQIGAFVRIGMSLLCFLALPATPPTDNVSCGWRAALGLTAFGLLRDRELRRFYIAAALLAVPGAAHFMITPTLLTDLGSMHPTGQMGLGQATEVGAMLLLSALAGRFRIRWFLVWGMSLAVLRFALFGLGAEFGAMAVVWLGIALNGPVYTFMTVAGRLYLDKRVPDTMRGQAQALFGLMVFNIAAILGAFLCEGLYRKLVFEGEGWFVFWLSLSGVAAVPLGYFLLGVFKESQD